MPRQKGRDCITNRYSRCTKKIEAGAEKKIFKINEGIPEGWMGLDIGPETIRLFSEKLSDAKTVFWNGPMGVFEIDDFAEGTKKNCRSNSKCYQKGCISIVGGGDSAAAAEKFGLAEEFSHVSTGGGASLEFLEGKELPGIASISVKKTK